MSHDASRRRFLTIAMVAVATAPIALRAASAEAAAPAALPKLPVTDAAAKALAYTENATAVKHAAFKAGSNCANCNFFKGAKGQAYGPCTLFPKNTVAAKGWCSAWAKKL
jgi:hypothetical protein